MSHNRAVNEIAPALARVPLRLRSTDLSPRLALLVRLAKSFMFRIYGPRFGYRVSRKGHFSVRPFGHYSTKSVAGDWY
jgi:hypothetical protein